MVLTWVAVLASVLGLVVVATALLRAQREHGPAASPIRQGARERWGGTLFLAGGFLLVVCGQYVQARLAREPGLPEESPAVHEAARARLLLLFRMPLTELRLWCTDGDPFHGPGAATLRLTFTDFAGSRFVSEIPPNDLRRREGSFEYSLDWKSVIGRATSERGRHLAGRVGTVSDLTRFRNLDVDLLAPRTPAPPIPGYLWIGFEEFGTVELFDGARILRQEEPKALSPLTERALRLVVSYRDDLPFEDRLAASGKAAPSPAEYRLGWSVLGIALGLLLILVSRGLRSPVPLPAATWAYWGPVGALTGLIVVVYLWLITVGTFTKWVPNFGTHNLLADAFLQGQVYLPLAPSPELLAQPDPYAYAAETKHASDLSLYDGKYYLYWGPVPAFLIAAARLLLGIDEVADYTLVLGFSLGYLLFSILLLRELWRHLYSDIPWLTVLPGVLGIGLAAPVPGLLSDGSVYAAPVLGGQCFLVGGLYWAYSALRPARPVLWRLALAGVFWAMAVTTRLPLAAAVGALALAVAWRAARACPGLKRGWQLASALGCFVAPLLVGAGAMAAYNYARFDSPFETGHRYVLSAGSNTHAAYEEKTFFNLGHLIPNLYSYLFRPPTTQWAFPYLKGFSTDPFPPWLPVPERYWVDFPVIGLAFTSPFLGFAAFALLACWPPFAARWGAREPEARLPVPGAPGRGWVVACLLTGAVLGVFPSLLAPGAVQRYVADAAPFLLILAMVGVWEGARLFAPRPFAQTAWVVCATFLAVFTAVCGVSYAMTGDADRFRDLNPCLLEGFARTLPRGRPFLLLALFSLVLLSPLLPLLVRRTLEDVAEPGKAAAAEMRAQEVETGLQPPHMTGTKPATVRH